MQEEHKEQRIKTVMSLKRDLELNEVELFRCVICTHLFHFTVTTCSLCIGVNIYSVCSVDQERNSRATKIDVV